MHEMCLHFKAIVSTDDLTGMLRIRRGKLGTTPHCKPDQPYLAQSVPLTFSVDEYQVYTYCRQFITTELQRQYKAIATTNSSVDSQGAHVLH